MGNVILMYHELQAPDASVGGLLPGYLRYVVRRDVFQAQLGHLKSAGYRLLSVSQGLEQEGDRAVVLTFDDGACTDLLIAAPLLAQVGANATFYVVAGWTRRPGYLSESQMRELAAAGFEIGCHSMTHRYLSDLDESSLRTEIADAKDTLEQILGRPVEHFSCPGGRWTRAAIDLARTVGFKSVATSRIGAIDRTKPFCLPRLAVMRQTSPEQFSRMCDAKSLWPMRVGSAVRATAKCVLGNSLYEGARAAALAVHNRSRRATGVS